ncbi:MAG: acyl-CoA thioesterase [Rhodospirillales bacterium]|nr:acyl-CoA thioesterase [Rhodospirillales bacterium]
MFLSTHKVQVLWHDCDPAAIVFYGNYYRWMDDATYYLFVKADLEWNKLKTIYDKPSVPLVSAHGDFRSPAKFGDVLTIESHVSEWGTRSFTVSHVFHNGDKIAAEGYEKRVWCRVDPNDPGNIKAFPIPDEVRKALGG